MTRSSISLLIIFLVNISAQINQECYDDGAEFCIYQEDILSADLLPDSFLLLDQRPDLNETSSRITNNGTIDEAFNTMGFHRKKMNEFFCHGFLAEQILSEVGGARVKRRLGNTPQDISLLEYMSENNVSMQEKLLSDEGSSKYKDWLQKTTTLDDIYRHYAPRSKGKKISKKSESADNRYDNIGEEYDGAVTGYAMPAPIPSGKAGGYYNPSGPDHYAAPSGHHPHQMDYIDHHGDFYPQIHEEHYYSPPSHHEHEHHYEHHRPSYQHGKGKGHELSLKDFFEIALTAIAFLAFGLFIIQLIMSATNAATATSAAAFLQADIEGTRYKRESVSPLGYTGNEELNELSHRVLRSIEAVLAAEQDNGNCLRRVLCDDNKDSRENTGGRRIWIPVWSLGMSWLSGRMLRRSPWSTTLGSVKAAVLGLGGADCAVIFPDCDLKHEVTKSRRRRRKK